MKQTMEQFLTGYAQSSLTGEAAFDRNIRLQLGHTFRVRDLARAIAAADIGEPRLHPLGELAALLHDLGRFEQFKRFRTFNDSVSLDHGDLSAELAEQFHLLDALAPADHAAVLAAVRGHNKRDIPGNFSADATALAKLVRDADKIDIIPILLDYLAHPDNDAIVYRLSPEPRYSAEVLASLRSQKPPFHRQLKTVADFIASKVSWVYDLNYPAAK